MCYAYICAGNLIMDSRGMMNSYLGCEEYPGGPATFAYTGVRIWTDSVMQVSRTGADYDKYFGDWIRRNKVETKGIKVVCDRSNHLYGFMHAYAHDPANLNAAFSRGHATQVEPSMRRYVMDAWQDFGYQKIRPEDIGEFTKGGGVKGVYLAANPDSVFWRDLGKIKDRDGFKIMWEIEGVWARKEFMDLVVHAAQYADIFSINLEEAKALFACESDEDCIKGLQTLPVDMTLFRVGARGLYVVTKNDAIYLPPAPGPMAEGGTVGCGNSSTGGAMYAYCEGKDPLMVGIMANISSARNLMQPSVIPEFVSIRENCYAQAEALYEHYKNNRSESI